MIKKAFTLAEVLMVIGIIGVIAAVTIPNLSQNVDSEKNIALLRGIVADVNTAIGKIGMGGDPLFTVCGYSDTNCYGREISGQMKIGKNCGTDPYSGCFSGGYRGLSCGYAFVLANGASCCTIPQQYKQSYKFFIIDVDGPKKGTNTTGEDQFAFEVSDDGLVYDNHGSRSSRDMFLSNADETAWAMIVGNQDYLTCPGVLQWGVKEGCQ